MTDLQKIDVREVVKHLIPPLKYSEIKYVIGIVTGAKWSIVDAFWTFGKPMQGDHALRDWKSGKLTEPPKKQKK